MDEMISVDGKTFKCPSSFKWKKNDISASDAGRTDDTLMHKNKVGEKRTLSLGWVCLSKAEIHEILVAFEAEYVNVPFWDTLDGKATTRRFYTGDMDAEVKWWAKGRERYSTLNFEVIER